MRLPTQLRGVGIGAGYFAPFQYEAWTRIPEVEITAISNRSEERGRALLGQFGLGRFYSDWKEMIDIERPDFVDIITPPETHEEICSYAAKRGIHIICQKPLASNLEISKRIVEYAEACNVRFMVHENWRWQPWYRAIKQIAQDKTIGDFTHIHFLMRTGDGWGSNAYLARQPFFREYPRLLVYETGVHFIDTFRYLLGEAASVFAQIRRLNPAIQGEDAGQLFFNFESGATAVLDANRYNEVEAEFPRLTLGQLRIDATNGHITMDTEANLRLKVLGEPGRAIQFPWENKNFGGDCVYALQRHFVDCMLSGKNFESNGRDYLNTVKVVEAVYVSAMKSQLVMLR